MTSGEVAEDRSLCGPELPAWAGLSPFLCRALLLSSSLPCRRDCCYSRDVMVGLEISWTNWVARSRDDRKDMSQR